MSAGVSPFVALAAELPPPATGDCALALVLHAGGDKYSLRCAGASDRHLAQASLIFLDCLLGRCSAIDSPPPPVLLLAYVFLTRSLDPGAAARERSQ